MTRCIAFYTVGLLKHPYEHPELSGLWRAGSSVFGAAEASAGFLNQVPWDGVTAPEFSPLGQTYPAQTLSVWVDLEAVFAFAYRGAHAQAMRRRKKWFLDGDEQPSYVAWWIEENQTPTWAEAVERHAHLYEHGPTAHAFTFKAPFDVSGNATQLRRRGPTD